MIDDGAFNLFTYRFTELEKGKIDEVEIDTRRSEGRDEVTKGRRIYKVCSMIPNTPNHNPQYPVKRTTRHSSALNIHNIYNLLYLDDRENPVSQFIPSFTVLSW